MPLMGSAIDWTWLRKESMSLKICQQKLPKLKGKEKTEKKSPPKQEIHKIWDNFKKLTYVIKVAEGKRRQKRVEEIFEVLMVANFPKLMTTPNHRSRKLREYQVR